MVVLYSVVRRISFNINGSTRWNNREWRVCFIVLIPERELTTLWAHCSAPVSLWEGDSIRPQVSCMSYEATKRVSRWQRVYLVRLRQSPV